MGTSGLNVASDNKILFLAVGLAGHEVEAIGDVYFNDEVVTFEPYYDSYAACTAMAGARRRVVMQDGHKIGDAADHAGG